MSESDCEFGCGSLSLDGKVGCITLKELTTYIKEKHEGKNPKIPLYSSVHMHAGKADHKEGLGSWEGVHAFMQFELMCDQFDALFNLAIESQTQLMHPNSSNCFGCVVNHRGGEERVSV